MKKLLILLTVVALVLTAVACGNGETRTLSGFDPSAPNNIGGLIPSDPATNGAGEAIKPMPDSIVIPAPTTPAAVPGTNSPGDGAAAEPPAALGEPDPNVDIDLSVLSSTMVYAHLYSIIISAHEYIGKTVKIRGTFGVYLDQGTNTYYFGVIVSDNAGCCSQGLEFVLAGDHTYPDDYPEVGTQITVIGEFNTYKLRGYPVCHLTDAVIVDGN